MPVRGHTLNQSRPGFTGKSAKNISTEAGRVDFQHGSPQKSGLAGATNRGLKRRGSQQ